MKSTIAGLSQTLQTGLEMSEAAVFVDCYLEERYRLPELGTFLSRDPSPMDWYHLHVELVSRFLRSELFFLETRDAHRLPRVRTITPSEIEIAGSLLLEEGGGAWAWHGGTLPRAYGWGGDSDAALAVAIDGACFLWHRRSRAPQRRNGAAETGCTTAKRFIGSTAARAILPSPQGSPPTGRYDLLRAEIGRQLANSFA